jgi:hypothetical protein
MAICPALVLVDGDLDAIAQFTLLNLDTSVLALFVAALGHPVR